jgi:SAM-dependent methyltransferase
MDKILTKVQNYWNKQPCNIKHSKIKKFTKQYFEEVKKKKYFVEKHIPNFANFKKYKNKTVLEIGCGIGTDAIEFIKNGANYYGVDLSKKSIEICKLRVKRYGLENKKNLFIVDNCENLRKIKKLNLNLDLIYSFGVIHHTHNMKKAFQSIFETANKNTQIKIMLYAKNSYKNFLINESKYRYEAQKGCPVVYTVDDQDLKRILNNKFKILSKKQDFIFPYKIRPYKKGKYEKIKHFKYMPEKTFEVLKKNIGEHMLLELKKI